MKYLIINGSPRKGNTWVLTEKIVEKLQTLDKSAQFEEVHLKDIDLPFCLGCSSCFRKGHTTCPHNNVIQPIMDKIQECDAVIFSVTCYQMYVTALAKNFTDHLCYMLHRPRYFDKKALIVSTTGGVGASGATKFMAGTLRGWGFNRCYELALSSISWNAYHPKENHLKKLYKITEKFYKDVSSRKLHSPKSSVLIPFNLFRGMSKDYKTGTEFESQDGVYWEKTGFAKKVYAPNVPLPLHKKLFGYMFYLIAKKISSRMIVTYKK